MVFKVLLAPVWLVLCLLKWTSLIATGFASVVLRLGGMLLLLIGVAYLALGFEPFLTIRVFAVGIGAMVAPFLASVVTGVLEVGQTLMSSRHGGCIDHQRALGVATVVGDEGGILVKVNMYALLL